MKKTMIIITLCLGSFFTVTAQSYEVQQLLLDVEKLAQFKNILSDMKKGYEIIFKGYTAVKDISRGNFHLHQLFLDGLLEVSPAVKKYKRVADIIAFQQKMIREAHAALAAYRRNGQFSTEELEYLQKVYDNVLTEGLHSLEDLLMVLTAGKLRMSDDERLQVIDQVYARVMDQYAFLQAFSSRNSMLALERTSEKVEIEMSRRIGGHE